MNTTLTDKAQEIYNQLLEKQKNEHYQTKAAYLHGTLKDFNLQHSDVQSLKKHPELDIISMNGFFSVKFTFKKMREIILSLHKNDSK